MHSQAHFTPRYGNCQCSSNLDSLSLVDQWSSIFVLKIMAELDHIYLPHLANGPCKNSLNFIFPTKYGIPKSSKGYSSHWLSKLIISTSITPSWSQFFVCESRMFHEQFQGIEQFPKLGNVHPTSREEKRLWMLKTPDLLTCSSTSVAGDPSW